MKMKMKMMIIIMEKNIKKRINLKKKIKKENM